MQITTHPDSAESTADPVRDDAPAAASPADAPAHAPLPGRPSHDSVRAKILEAAAANFEEFGYAGTNLRTIASDAGFTKGAIYSNFGSKPDLFCQVATERMSGAGADVFASLTPVLATAADRRELVEGLGRALTQSLLGYTAWELIIAEFRGLAPTDPQVAAGYAALSRERIDRLIELLVTSPLLAELADPDLRSLAAGALGLLNVMAVDHIAAPEVYTEDFITEIVTHAVEGLIR